jgi:hypothetical protein
MNVIQLLPEQQKALDGPTPARVLDPRTNKTYVLVGERDFARLQQLAYDDSPWTDEERELLAWEAGTTAGWEQMTEYDQYKK